MATFTFTISDEQNAGVTYARELANKSIREQPENANMSETQLAKILYEDNQTYMAFVMTAAVNSYKQQCEVAENKEASEAFAAMTTEEKATMLANMKSKAA